MPLLDDFKIYHFSVGNEVLTPLKLPADQPGKAIRGAFYEALLERFCNNKTARTCAECPLNQSCPVSTLVAPLRDENSRGRDIVRPYCVRPPQLNSEDWLKPGQSFEFGLTIFGRVLNLLPYVALALHTMGQNGIGGYELNVHRRGRFKTISLKTVNLLTRQSQELLDQKSVVKAPSLHSAMTANDVAARVKELQGDQLKIELITPLRLVDDARLVRQFAFRPFFQRLLDRLLALNTEYSEGDKSTLNLVEYKELVAKAAVIKLEEDSTSWQEVGSYSARQGKVTPIGGLVGQVTLRGDFSQLLPWLVWGEVIQVGKDVVKGNGCYRLQLN